MVRLLMVALAMSLTAAARPTLHRFEAVEPHMGTLVQVVVFTAGEEQARAAFRIAFDRIAELDSILSDYRPDSELNRVTKTVGRPVPIGADLFAVLAASQELAAATDGAFDVTQGPVTRLWRQARALQRAPDPSALREAAARGGYRKLRLDPLARTATVAVDGMALDVGAIGKGYAASEAVAALRRHGVARALVAISGDLAFGDAPPGQRGWRVAVHAREESVAGVPGVLELTNAAVSTSGNAAQHLDAGGTRYSHVIDPSSAMGLTDDVTVTVVARHGLEADGLDTAISVLGAPRGMALADSRPDAAAVIVQRTAGKTHAYTSARFRALIGAGQ